jgi:hypothetical protein
MWRRRKFWIIAFVVFALATLGKQTSNDWYSYTHKGPARGILDAKEKGLYLSKFRIDPPILKHEDITFEFGEAWVEARHEQWGAPIWYTEMRRTEWDYFCLEQKTPSYKDGVSITLTPEFHPAYKMESIGELDFFSERGNLWYSRVSPELQRVKITVNATFYGKRKTINVGTAELVRE